MAKLGNLFEETKNTPYTKTGSSSLGNLFESAGKTEQAQYNQAAEYANSPTGLLTNAAKAVPGILLRGAQSVVNEPYNQLLVKPVMSAARLVSTGIGALVGGQTGANIKNAAQQPMSVSGPIGGSVTNQPQQPFGQGGATQIASDALKTASWLAPAGRVESAASNLVKGNVLKTITGGFTGGSIYGGLGGAGDALAQPNPTLGSVAKDTATGALAMGAVGAGLGVGGILASKLLKAKGMVQTAMDVAKPEYTKTGEVPITKTLPVQSAETKALPVNVQTPYLKPNEMPIIDYGKKTPVKSSLPTIDYGTPKETPVLAKSKQVTQSPLHQEALKYKSAEEFVKTLTTEKNGVTSIKTDLPTKILESNGPLWDFKPSKQKITEPILVTYNKGTYTVVDGHHRLSQALINNQKTLPSRLVFKDSDGNIAKITKSQLTDIYNQAHAKSDPKTIQPNQPKEAAIKYVPIKEKVPILAKETKISPRETPITVRKTGTITKTASKINESLVKQGFDALPPEVQSKYTSSSYKAIEKNISEEMTNSIENAINMATGKTPLTKSIHGHGQILFNAVKNYATKTGDSHLMLDLASSPLGQHLSESAQKMGEAGFNRIEMEGDPIAHIQAIQKARQDAIMGRTDVKKVKQETVQNVKASIKKTHTKEDWHAFLDSITC